MLYSSSYDITTYVGNLNVLPPIVGKLDKPQISHILYEDTGAQNQTCPLFFRFQENLKTDTRSNVYFISITKKKKTTETRNALCFFFIPLNTYTCDLIR